MNNTNPQTQAILNALIEVFPNADLDWANREIQAERIYLRNGVLCLDHASTCVVDPPDPQAAKAYILKKRESWRTNWVEKILPTGGVGSPEVERI